LKFKSGFVAIIGRPNVGKSTLLNHILGEKISIVTDKPQTTRNRILGVYHAPEAQMVFLDTPGIHQARGGLNRRMVQTAWASLKEVDLIFYLVDPKQPHRSGDALIVPHLEKIKTPKLLVFNKIDLLNRDQMIPLLDVFNRADLYSEVIPISARTGENVARLLHLALSFLPEGKPYFPEDVITDKAIRFLAAEIIREKVIELTREELPYVVAVEIEAFKEEAARELTTIHATLYVERTSQKGILIGKKGVLLKEVGQQARLEIEGLLATKIHLVLWVKVKKNWRKDEYFLNEFKL